MTKDIRNRMDYWRWLGELLFSLYVAFFVVNREASKEASRFIDWFGIPLVSVDRYISHWRDGRLLFPRTDAPLEFNYGLYCFLGLVLFACLRLLDRIPSSRAVTDYMIAVVTAAGPLFTPVFLSSHLQGNGLYALTDEGHLIISRWLQDTETVLVLAFLCLCHIRKWPMKVPALILTTHFIFWSMILVGRDWPESRTNALEYLLLPLAVTILWSFATKPNRGGNGNLG